MQMYDIIIVGGGASGLFCSLFLPKGQKKCIIEKTDKLGSKVLLSGGERCNLTNITIDLGLHYVGQSLKALPSLFHTFGPEDMIAYLTEHGIETNIEENGRVLLKSGKAKQLVEFLVNESKNNETEHVLNHEVLSIQQSHSEGNEKDSIHSLQGDKENTLFVVTTSAGVYAAKRIIVATGGMTYPQIGASPFAYELVEQLGIGLAVPHGALCGLETREDFSSLAGNTVQAMVKLYCENKLVYSAKGPVLFTHWGLSGPIVFDATLYIGDISKYALQIDVDLSGASKKVVQFFGFYEGNTVRDVCITALRPITEAKVSVGGVLLKELDQFFQSKKIPGLFFIGESLDITGKTGGYNLQWAWTSAYTCAKLFFHKVFV